MTKIMFGVGLLMGFLAKYFKWFDIDLEATLASVGVLPEETEEEERIADCPQCGLPAEVPSATITREYAIHCLGDHEPIPVKEVWIQI